MRLYDTYTRAKRELPEPPGPVRSYFCGPTVYARAHIGNARPFVIGMWLTRWLRERGYEAVVVHNITDINDKIYDAAPGASAELAERATEWYLQDTADFGLGMPDHQPKASELIPQIVAAIEELIGRDYAYEVSGDVYYRVARFEEYGNLSRTEARPARGPGAERAKAGSARLRALESEQAGRGHVLGIAVGTRAAGLAHRVLGDGRATARPGVRDPRRRARSRLPAPRERDRAVARARPSVRRDLDAQRDAPLRRREDVEVGRQHRHDPRGARPLGARSAARVLPHGALVEADRLFGRHVGAAEARAESLREVFRNEPEPAAEGEWDGSPRHSTTTSTRPRRSRSCTPGATTSCSAARWASSASHRSQRRRRRHRRWSTWPSGGGGRGAEGDFAEADRLRGAIEEPAGWSAT